MSLALVVERFDRFLSVPGLDVVEVLDITVAGRAMWKLTSADTLSSSLAMFSLDLDFIKDNSDSVFFGSFESGESCTEVCSLFVVSS